MQTTKNIRLFINSIVKNNINRININTQTTQIIINKEKNQKNVQRKTLQTYSKAENKKSDEIDSNKKKIQDNNVEKNKTKNYGVYSTIVSPMVGTFYRSPAPNENVFVEIGDTLKPKQVVCIIEAMKLMNEIESEVKGEVVEILVKDGDIVDCGQALLKVKIK